jgi:hypothetical protein
MISPETHDGLTRAELLALIAVCERCECEFNCYCASNITWAERELAKLDLKSRSIPPQQCALHERK